MAKFRKQDVCSEANGGRKMVKILIVGLGGFIGSNLRWGLSHWINQILDISMPVGTLFVNGLGSMILAAIAVYSSEAALIKPEWRLFFTTGMMGALTTFSTFSLETLQLYQDKAYIFASLNILLNISIGLLGAITGMAIIKHFF